MHGSLLKDARFKDPLKFNNAINFYAINPNIISYYP